MPAALPAEKRRDVIIQTRLTPSDGARLQALAERRATTVAALTRQALRQAGLLPERDR